MQLFPNDFEEDLIVINMFFFLMFCMELGISTAMNRIGKLCAGELSQKNTYTPLIVFIWSISL